MWTAYGGGRKLHQVLITLHAIQEVWPDQCSPAWDTQLWSNINLDNVAEVEAAKQGEIRQTETKNSK